MIIGYSDSTKGYRCLDPTTNEVITSRDVIFLETKPANIEEIEDVQSVLTDSLSNEKNNENEEDPNDASNVPERMVTQPTEVHDERNVPERNVRRSSQLKFTMNATYQSGTFDAQVGYQKSRNRMISYICCQCK
ncbi:hypothetical protein QE152_g1727 [Popillia japonica]|uniref:Retroviral polymerase SH3-like domain-containing protein n=1 Tax=Popillia japonica TaxID=7064 RepID=A0AAW1N5X0_POPJA